MASAKHDTRVPSLEEMLTDCCKIMDLATGNQYNTAVTEVCKWSSVTLYHSHFKALLIALRSALTLEKDDILHALEVAKEADELCDKYRKQHSMASSVWNLVAKTDYTKYTEVQLHAEIIKGFMHLVVGTFTIFSDQTIMTMVKAALRMQAGHSLIKSCTEITRQEVEWSSDISRSTFYSAYYLGQAGINLVLSHLPDRVLMILNYVGYTGDRELAYELFDKCIAIESSPYRVIAKLVRCFYETLVVNIIGARNVDLNKVSQCIVNELNKENPSAFFLLIAAQVKKFTGDLETAIDIYGRSIRAQDDLKELKYIGYWDLCTVHGCEWDLAAKYANMLFEKNNWSRATYLYMSGAFLYMKMIDEDRPELKTQVSELFRLVPKYKVRFAGKTIPPEKFVCVSAEKYFRNNETLPVPAIDIFYIWNIFCMARLNPTLVDPLIARIDKVMPGYKKSGNLEDYLILQLYKGVCFKIRRQYIRAEKCLNEIIDNEKTIKAEKQLLPMACLELGLTKLNTKSYTEAEQWLKKAKGYSGYLFELVIVMKIHTVLQKLKKISKDELRNDELDECI